jgi:serine/threonine protein kinase/Flp pilus assembly protein TadD
MYDDPTVPLGVEPADRPETPPTTAAWGSFTLLARVGVGGFGEVYRAWDPNLQREVALKLLLPGAVSGEAEYEAMLREARALASVRHPNIVPVYGIDRHNGRVGFWTDFVHGKTLSVLVTEQGTFGAREAALIGLDVARALSAVHRAGLLHRDIKAENVMREQGGRILLMDFGLSSLEQLQTNIAGTPSYMAPELFQGGQSTVATDIYAMGVMLYYLVAEDYPVRLAGLTPTEALAALAKRRPLMDLRSDLPESLLRTVSTATEMDPAKRFASAGQLASALAESLGTSVPAEAVSVPAMPVSPPSVPAAPPVKDRTRNKTIRRLVVAAVLIGVFVFRPGYLQRLLHRTNSSASVPSGTTYDQFQKAHELLLRSYKEANVAEAVKGFQSVLQSDPTFALANARLGLAYFIQYRASHDPKLLDLAKDATNRAINLDPNLAPPYITLSRIAAMQGQSALAMEQAHKALDLDPRNAEVYGALGEVYEAEGKTADAVSSYQKAIDIAPDDWRWPVRLGNQEFHSGNAKDAVIQFQRGVDLAPDNAVAYFNLGIAKMQLDRIDDARNDFEASLKIEPSGRTYAALGSVLLLNRKYDDAAEMDKKSIQLNPNDYVAWGNLGTAYRWSGTQQQKAIQAFRRAIELGEIARQKNRDDPELLVALADYYSSTGKAEECLTLIRQSIALAPGNPSIEYQAGSAYEALGQRDKAIPLIADSLARGNYAFEFQRNPELAKLRADPAFLAALASAKEKNK